MLCRLTKLNSKGNTIRAEEGERLDSKESFSNVEANATRKMFMNIKSETAPVLTSDNSSKIAMVLTPNILICAAIESKLWIWTLHTLEVSSEI